MGCCRFSPVFIAAAAFLLIQNATASEFVPVYTWETSKSNEIVPAIGHVNKATFKEILLQKVEKTNPFIVVFAEQNLSPEDFVVEDKKTFQHISKLDATNKVSYLPLVESPIEAFKELPAKETSEVSINDIVHKTELPQSRILIVNLNDAKDDEDRIDMLRRHDEIIVDVYNKLREEHKNVLAVLTGFHSSWIVPEDIKKHRQSRAVLANEDSDFKFTENFYLYLKGLTIWNKKSEETKSYALQSISSTDNVTLTISFNDSLSMKMTNKVVGGYWYIAEIEVKEDKVMSEIYAPLTFSYHCSNFSIAVKDNLISFLDFQLQFVVKGSETVVAPKFGDAYDCVGFTTTPIWSGLFVTLILIIIMTIGLTMMMDIKTMDRFDDPKGKTIIVSASE